MNLSPEELQFLTIPSILREATSIPKCALRPFYLITLTLIFPLSFAILAHSFFTHPILPYTNFSPDLSWTHHKWALLLSFQFLYIIFLFAFSHLSTVAIIFTVASLYTSKDISFFDTFSAISRVLKWLFLTFLWVSVLMLVYNFVFLVFLVLIVIAINTQNVGLLLEPVYGFMATRKSYELLKGRMRMAMAMV